jgi:hypothetical protein
VVTRRAAQIGDLVRDAELIIDQESRSGKPLTELTSNLSEQWGKGFWA